MAAIAGPALQMPTSLSPLTNVGADGRPLGVKPEWAAFFNALQQIAFCASRNGPTASRPTSAVIGRFIGMPYFDTTLGLSVFLKSINPDVWVKGDGTVV